MTNQSRINAVSTGKEIVAELTRMEGYLYNDIAWYAEKMGFEYKGEKTFKSDLQELYKKVASSYQYKMMAMKDAKEVGLNLNAKNYTLKQVRNKVLDAVGEDMDKLDKLAEKRKKTKVIVYEGSESVTDEDVKKLERTANKQAKAEKEMKAKEEAQAKAIVEQAMAEVAATTEQPKQEEEVVVVKQQEKTYTEEEVQAIVQETVEVMGEANKEVVDEAVESVVELYDALDSKGKELLEDVKEADAKGDFDESDKLMDEYDQVIETRDELAKKHKEAIFTKERAEIMLNSIRQGMADGLRTTATTTNKYGNAGVDTLMDVANQILAGTVKVAETIIKGGEAIAQTGINVAGTVGKATVSGVSGTMNAAADIIEPKQK